MNRLQHDIRPSIAKLICRNYPIIKKRAPIMFFFDDVRNNNCDTELRETISKAKSTKSAPPLRSIWNMLTPMQKMKYYKLAQLDETRYKEQTSLWVSKVAAGVGTEELDMEHLNDFAPDAIKTGLEAALLMDKYQRKYEVLIEAACTKRMVRDLIKQTENLSIKSNKDELLSSLPPAQATILSRPIRPASAYVIFINENIQNLRRLYKKRTNLKETFLAIAAREWSKLSKKNKDYYLKIHENRYKEFTLAMEKYLSDQEAKNQHGNSLDSQILKAKKLLSKEIRAKMRTSDVVPVLTTNAYIQFYKENTFLRDGRRNNNDNVVNAYLNLSDEEKAKYKKKFEEDLERYEKEKKRYVDIMVRLIDVMKKQTVEHKT